MRCTRTKGRGQALAVFALVIPLFLLVFLGVVAGGYYVVATTIVSHATHEGARFGTLVAKIPARRVGDAVDRLLALHAAEGGGEPITTFLQSVDPARVKAALADLEALAPSDAAPEDFVDLGDETEFTLGAMEGECSV